MSKQFENLVAEAVQTEQEFRSHSADCRMSAQALIDACLRLGDSNHHQLQMLQEVITAKGDRLRNVRAFVNQVSKLCESGRINSGPPRDYSRMAAAPSRDDARQELASEAPSHNLYECWAAGIALAGKRAPHAFGSVDDPLAWQHKLDSLKERRAELFEQIGKSFGPEDVVLDDIRADATARVTLKLAPQVPLGPTSTLGERLITHLLTTEPERWVKAEPRREPMRNARKGRPGLPLAGAG